MSRNGDVYASGPIELGFISRGTYCDETIIGCPDNILFFNLCFICWECGEVQPDEPESIIRYQF